jgi:ribulose-5-phosphate 4-epimerase/fuculose-1-phosphate aldolase
MSLKNVDRKWIDDFIAISHRIPRRGLTFGGGGGNSLRVPNSEKVLVKGWEVPSEDLREEDIALVDLQGNALNEVKICLEGPLHLGSKGPEGYQAVIHAHPLIRARLLNIRPNLTDGDLKNYPFCARPSSAPAEPGSDDLARRFRTLSQEGGCLCLYGTRVTVVGPDVTAYHRLFLEGASKAFVLTALLKNKMGTINAVEDKKSA